MELFQNPFHILGATSRDNRQRLVELAEERSLQADSNDCMQARSILSNPSKRLAAEIAWLPGANQKYTEQVFGWLSKPVQALPPKGILQSLSPMARSNILASGIQQLANYKSAELAKWIVELSNSFDDVEPGDLCALINEERIASGFPEVTDLSMIESEIQERRHHFRQVINSALGHLHAEDLVAAVTIAVEIATKNGDEHGPILISDVVDAYELEHQTFLEKEESSIDALIDKLRSAVEAGQPDTTLTPLLDQFIQVVRNWDTVAQPIQVSTRSRGLDHDASRRVAIHVRSFAIDMYNEHGKLEISRQITEMLQEVFAEVSRVAELAAEDAQALEEIAYNRFLLNGNLNDPPVVQQREVLEVESSETKQDEPDFTSTTHPWRRFFARWVDITIPGSVTLVGAAICFGLTFRSSAADIESALEYPIVAGCIQYIVWLPFEALSLSFLGTTPAKWLFGIRVLDISGTRLTFGSAFKRTLLVFIQGEGLGIPLVILATRISAYDRLTKTETTLWDDATGAVVTHRPWGVFRSIFCTLTVLAALLLVYVL